MRETLFTPNFSRCDVIAFSQTGLPNREPSDFSTSRKDVSWTVSSVPLQFGVGLWYIIVNILKGSFAQLEFHPFATPCDADDGSGDIF